MGEYISYIPENVPIVITPILIFLVIIFGFLLKFLRELREWDIEINIVKKNKSK